MICNFCKDDLTHHLEYFEGEDNLIICGTCIRYASFLLWQRQVEQNVLQAERDARWLEDWLYPEAI